MKPLPFAIKGVPIRLALVTLVASFFLLVGLFYFPSQSRSLPLKGTALDQTLQSILEGYDLQSLVPTTRHIKPVDDDLFELGKELFFSKTLSGNFDVSCASCHHPLLAGGDKLSLPVGESAYDPDLLGPGRWHNWKKSKDPRSYGGPNVPRHSQTIFNTALYNKAMFYDGRIFRLFAQGNKSAAGDVGFRTPDSHLWQADPLAGSSLLAAQARFPVVSAHEMLGFGFEESESHAKARDLLTERLRASKDKNGNNKWLELFRQAFKKMQAPANEVITFENIQEAIAAYERSQILIDNDWYAFVKGEQDRLTSQQKKGAVLFFTPAKDGGAGCVGCHQPPTFTDEKFHNIAVPQFGRGILAGGEDFGRRGVSQEDKDRYGFRTPSLLNVTHTMPYGHTGAFVDLRSVIKHHISPQTSLDAFDFTFANNKQLKHVAGLYGKAKSLSFDALKDLKAKQKSKASLLPADLKLTDEQIVALEAFLHSLTDPCLDDQNCLSKWIPDPKTASPDKHRLLARFAKDEGKGPPSPLRPLEQVIAKDVPLGDELKQVGASYSYRVACEAKRPVENKGGFLFNEIANEAGLKGKHKVSWDNYTLKTAQRVIFTGGVAAGDLDGDCWPDIYYPNGDANIDAIFRNKKDGTFYNVSRSWGIDQRDLSNGAAIADIDGDGDMDIITTSILHKILPSVVSAKEGKKQGEAPTIYLNKTGKKFEVETNTNISTALTGWSVAFADYDADGDLDALTTHWRGPGLGGERTNHLWKNNSEKGKLSFAKADEEAGLLGITGKSDFTFTGSFADINNDGFPDILMVADFEETQVYMNNGDGTFKKVTDQSQINDKNGMGAAVGDFDNDGDLDWFVSSVWDPNGVAEGTWGTIGNRLYRNDNGRFTDVTDKAGVAKGFWGWGSCFADFNNDSQPDLFQVNGFYLHPAMAKHLGGASVFMKLKRAMHEFERTPSRLYISSGDGTFQERSENWGVTDTKSGRAALCFDYDRDGDVDILVSNHQDRLLLYKNNARSKDNTNFLNVSLKGIGKNTKAVGAKIYVRANGVSQMQEIRAGGRFLSSAPLEAHFGIGAAKTIDEIKVVWPKPHYSFSVIKNVPANKFITISRDLENEMSVK